MTEQRSRITVVPITALKANAIVARWHRHHAPVPAGLYWFAVQAVDEGGRVVGVAIAGRPTNRNSDDGQTIEVLRVATDGSANACSALYGACARAAKALGAWRIITYTLTSESGASLRGSGWDRQKDDIESFWMDANTRTPAVAREHMTERKVRWGVTFRTGPLPVDAPEAVEDSAQTLLGLGA